MMVYDAKLSADGRYRWWLTRHWGAGRRAAFIMLNPSTADAFEDDTTIRRCMGFARSWGLDGIDVVNVFPWRATDPRDLERAAKRGADVTCRETRDRWIASVCGSKNTDRIVVAWGANRMAAEEAPLLLSGTDRVSIDQLDLWCLGTTKSGAPKHPLYLRADTPLTPWSVPDAP